LIELESEKLFCQLGRSLLVAKALGLNLVDSLASGVASPSTTALYAKGLDARRSECRLEGQRPVEFKRRPYALA
jgi:hypothetical protein